MLRLRAGQHDLRGFPEFKFQTPLTVGSKSLSAVGFIPRSARMAPTVSATLMGKGRCHRAHFDFSRYFGGLAEVLSIAFLASKSSLTVSAYQLMLPENLPFNVLLSPLNNSS